MSPVEYFPSAPLTIGYQTSTTLVFDGVGPFWSAGARTPTYIYLDLRKTEDLPPSPPPPSSFRTNPGPSREVLHSPQALTYQAAVFRNATVKRNATARPVADELRTQTVLVHQTNTHGVRTATLFSRARGSSANRPVSAHHHRTANNRRARNQILHLA